MDWDAYYQKRIDDFLDRMHEGYTVHPDFHRAVASKLEDLVKGTNDRELNYLFQHIEESYQFREMLEDTAGQMKSLVLRIQSEKDDLKKLTLIQEYKGHRAVFEECREYAAKRAAEFYKKAEDKKKEEDKK